MDEGPFLARELARRGLPVVDADRVAHETYAPETAVAAELAASFGYRLPAKWICDDGRTMYLVFSGRTFEDIIYDAFCVRKMTLTIAR